MAKVRCNRCSAENDLEQSGGVCSQCGSNLAATDIQGEPTRKPPMRERDRSDDDDIDIRRRPGDPRSRYDDDDEDDRRRPLRRYDDELDIRRRNSQDDPGDLSTGDWLLCIFCSGIGCIVGVVRLIQGRPSGGKMIGISLLFSIIWGVLRLIITEALNQQGARF